MQTPLMIFKVFNQVDNSELIHTSADRSSDRVLADGQLALCERWSAWAQNRHGAAFGMTRPEPVFRWDALRSGKSKNRDYRDGAGVFCPFFCSCCTPIPAFMPWSCPARKVPTYGDPIRRNCWKPGIGSTGNVNWKGPAPRHHGCGTGIHIQELLCCYAMGCRYPLTTKTGARYERRSA